MTGREGINIKIVCKHELHGHFSPHRGGYAHRIAAATSAAAAVMGLDETGLIAQGKSADFVVLQANPLDDITNTRGIIDVYLRGERIDRPGISSRILGTD